MSMSTPKDTNLAFLNSIPRLETNLRRMRFPRRQKFDGHSPALTSISVLDSAHKEPPRPPPIGLILMSMISETYQTLTDQFMGFSFNGIPLLQHTDESFVTGDRNINEDFLKKNALHIRRTLKRMYKELYLLEHISINGPLTTDTPHLRTYPFAEGVRNRGTDPIPLLRADTNDSSVNTPLPNLRSSLSALQGCSPSNSNSPSSKTNSTSLPDIIPQINLSHKSDSEYQHGSRLLFHNTPFHLKKLKLKLNHTHPDNIVMGNHKNLNSVEDSFRAFPTRVDVRRELYSPNNIFSLKAIGPIPPFPIVSKLKAGTYTLTLDEMEWCDLKFPLKELKVTIIHYRMVYEKKEYVLKPFGSQTFHNDPPVMSSGGRNGLYLFHIPPLSFQLLSDHQLAVFALLIRCTRELVCWTLLSAVDLCLWVEPLRGMPCNIKEAMKYGGNILDEAAFRGRILSASSYNGSLRKDSNMIHEKSPKLTRRDDADDLDVKNTESGSLPSRMSSNSSGGEESMSVENDTNRYDEILKSVNQIPKPPPLMYDLLFTSDYKGKSNESESDTSESSKSKSDSQSFNDSNTDEEVKIDTSKELSNSRKESFSPVVSRDKGPPTRLANAFAHPLSSQMAEETATNRTGRLASSIRSRPSLETDPSLSMGTFEENSGSTPRLGGSKGSRPCPHARLPPAINGERRLVVPMNYKRNDIPTSCVDLSPFDVPASNYKSVWKLLKETQPVGGGEPQPIQRSSNDTIKLSIYGVFGAPVNSIYTRVLVYVMDAIDPENGALMHPLSDAYSFLRTPDLIAYQTRTSSALEPKFTADLSLVVGKTTSAVVIVEYTTEEERIPIVLGHCCLLIREPINAGNFLSRLRMGDPRRSMERNLNDKRTKEEIVEEEIENVQGYTQLQMEATIDSQALRNLLLEPPLTRAECVPMGLLAWRLNSDNVEGPYDLAPEQIPPSEQEICILRSRQCCEPVVPAEHGITDEFVERCFSHRPQLLRDRISYISLFNPDRGLFLKVEDLCGLDTGKDAVYVVVVNLLEKCEAREYSDHNEWDRQIWRHLYYTRPRNSMLNGNILYFIDPPFILSDIAYHPYSMVFFTVLKVILPDTSKSLGDAKTEGKQGGPQSGSAQTPNVEEIGWTTNRLFLDRPSIIRQGRFSLPLLNMSILKNVIDGIKKESFQNIYLSSIQDQKNSFVSPKTTLTVAQGDPACIVQILSDLPGRPHIHQLLMPFSVRDDFPINSRDSSIRCSPKDGYESNLRMDDEQLMDKVHYEVDKYLKRKAEKQPV